MGRIAAWRWLFGASVVAVGVADAIVLDLVKAYFGSGYNGFALRGFGERAAFFAGGAVLDGAALAAIWLACLAAARAARARPLRALAFAGALGVALPLALDLAFHRLHRVLGDVLDLRLLLDLAAGSWADALGEASQDLPSLAVLGAAGALAAAGAFGVVARIERASPRLASAEVPRLRRLASLLGGCFAAGAIALGWAAAHAPALEFGWSTKPAGRGVRAVVSALSDVDRDGYGWLARPADPEPFDARIHPFAIDVAANGIDEDGVGGDLPAGIEVPRPIAVPAPRPPAAAPSVVLFFLESFRADVIGARVGGRDVTPNLSRMAASGTRAVAYAHVPVTWASRASLLQGRVLPAPGAATLIDDFLARGYEAAWFSAQHDGVAADRARLGLERLAHFYDARADVARRTSRSAQAISLQVSWKTLRERVGAYLRQRERGRPLFLYVNVVDTHFPYWHDELDDVLASGPLPRSAIRPEHRAQVWLAYLNAAANVDRAVGAIAAECEASLGPGVLSVVVADHGQSFYEDGLLGHGQSLGEAQSAVPFVLAGRRVALPQPLALSDLRGLIGHWLDGTEPPTAELARSEIFQHVGDVSRPRRVGLRSERALVDVDPVGDFARAGAAELRALNVWQTLRASAETRSGAGPE